MWAPLEKLSCPNRHDCVGYRLHPVEWNVGEAAGALAAWCMARGLQPRQVRGDAALLNDFQSLLRDKLGFILEWPEYARLTPR